MILILEDSQHIAIITEIVFMLTLFLPMYIEKNEHHIYSNPIRIQTVN